MADLDKIYFDIFAGTWDLFKNCLPVLDTDTYWQAVMQAAGNLYRQYRDTPQETLTRRLILDAVDELERLAKTQAGD